ncbi:MAG: ATP-binding cassette domain-containing protein [Planctomycetota bacterium]
MEAAVSIRNIEFRRQGPEPFVLSVPSLDVASGETVALVGPSGSGKSTLLGLLSGELLPNSGEVRVAGTRIDTLSEPSRRAFRRSHIGVVAQTLSLIDYLTGLENILLVALMQSGVGASKSRAIELARSLEVEHVLKRRPNRMSQGERQRIAICRALLLKPPVLLCDEPTGNLDADRGDRAMRLMLDAARQGNAAVLIATHDQRLVPMADRVVSLASATSTKPAAEPA